MSIDKIKTGDDLTQSLDIVSDNISKLKELFPEVLTEGKIDFKVLQDILGNEIEEEEEFYRFTWAGKSQSRREAHKPSTGTLRPCKEESVDWDTTQNLYIEGDNLEVLKLLQKSYSNKIKMIYIDPPYNTGKDFVYKDNYKDNLKNYQQITGQVDSEGNKMSTNSESEGRYHSNWLNMMYPRLRLARNLLKEDGVIFISIADEEIDNLRKICSEIFGENNLIANLIWEQGRKSMASTIAVNHEYCLIYAKNRNELTKNVSEESKNWKEKKDGLNFIYDKERELVSKYGNNFKEISNELKLFYKNLPDEHPSKRHKHYNNIDNKGIYFAGDISQGTGNGGRFDIIHPKTLKPCVVPTGGWRFGEKKLPEMISSDRIHFGIDESTVPCLKRYLRETEYEVAPSVFYKDGRGASKRVETLMNGKVFDFPKDEFVIKQFIEYCTSSEESECIILDFYGGSGTTAHSVFIQNLEDSIKRRFIQVQLPEPTDEKSEAFKSGYKTVTEIGKERIRRAGKKIKEENPLLSGNLDIGFKVFKLDSSNIKGWDGLPDNLENSLFESQDNIKSDRKEEDVLYEILLKYGLDLTLPIEEKVIEGKKVFNVGFGALFICLGNDLTSKVAEGIGQWKETLKPETCRVIFKDGGFTDVEKTNSVQTLKRFGIQEIKSI
jgi:adenine-specific DNA-methyltransferase